MDILSIIALSKANKALKGGSASSSIVYYEFTCAYSGGHYTVTTDATVAAILEDISDGKLPVAVIHVENSDDALAYVKSYSDTVVTFQTLSDITAGGSTAWQVYWNAVDSWLYEQVPPSIS